MTSCTQCGAELDNANQFCTQCGARRATVQSSGTATAVQPAPAAPVADTAIADLQFAERSGVRPMVWLVVLIAIVAAVGAFFFAERTKSSGPAPIIDGRAAASSETFGLDRYPGAHPVSAQISTSDAVLASFETSDSPDQVIGYYRVRFPINQVASTASGEMLRADLNGRQVTVLADALVHGSRVLITFSR
jgi:hypothetical protein